MKLFDLSNLPPAFEPEHEEALKYGEVTILFDNEYCAVSDGKFYRYVNSEWVESNTSGMFRETPNDGLYFIFGPFYLGGSSNDPIYWPFSDSWYYPPEFRDYKAIRAYLRHGKKIGKKGLIFWVDGEAVCKIDLSDVGLE